jgi:RNA polymerase sigma-70 factor (ECF subfamily)
MWSPLWIGSWLIDLKKGTCHCPAGPLRISCPAPIVPIASAQPSSQADDDRVLMRGIASRDASALASLYDRRGPILFALCLRILRDRMAAEEALEDVFFEIWSKPDRFDPARGEPMNYLLNLTQSRAIDKLRGRAKLRRMQLETDREQGQDSPASPASTAQTAPSADPAARAADAERRAAIRKAVGRLSPEQRQAVELAFFDGFTHSEISQRLSVPLGTIKTRIRQGLVRLKDALRDPATATPLQ